MGADLCKSTCLKGSTELDHAGNNTFIDMDALEWRKALLNMFQYKL